MPRRRRSHYFFVTSWFAIAATMLSTVSALGQERGLTLERAIRRSLTGMKMQGVHEFVNQARADAHSASLIPNPSLSIEASLLPLSRRYTVEAPGGPTELSAGISYSVDWLLFGKRAAAVASAETGIGVAEAECTDIARRRAMQTAEAFYDVLEAEALLKLAERTRGDVEQVQEAIRKSAAGGGRPHVEVSRIRLEAQGARRAEQSARSAVISAKSTLQALLGDTGPAASLNVVGTLDAPLVTKPLAVKAAYAVAVKNRPDIMALRKRLAKARRDETIEDRNAWPEATLGFGVARQFQRSIGAPDVTAWGAGIEVGLPLFDRNQGNRDKAASAAAQATLELTATLTELHAEVEQAVASLSTALQAASGVAETELELASQVRDSFRKAYEAGGGALIEMLDAQRAYHETFRAYVTTRADYWRSLFRYQASLGMEAAL
jgi:cobalt-zinc-cadmium efflux system outer membrane protein